MFPIKKVSQTELAFPTSVDGFLPPYAEIQKYRDHPKWSSLVSDWFFCGLARLELKPKEGIDEKAALRHIRYVMGSFEPSHEHKHAGVAFLLDEWFENVTWEPKSK